MVAPSTSPACKDDGGNPQTNLQIVQAAVQQDQVFAMVGLSADVLPASTDFMNQQQVPYLGWGFLPGFCHTRWGFGFNGCLIDVRHRQPEGVPEQPGARADRGRGPQAQPGQGGVAGR